MILKKYALLSSALIVLGLPVLASATPVGPLNTSNYTNEVSTVKITSPGSHYCSASPPFNEFTPAQGHSSTTQAQIKSICQLTGGICTAEVYATSNCDAMHALPIAHITINLDTLVVTLVGKMDNPKYNIVYKNPWTVLITY